MCAHQLKMYWQHSITKSRHFLDRAFKNTVQNQTLVALRDTLLPKLISGELRVPEGTVKLGCHA
jgi:hypothetical protein